LRDSEHLSKTRQLELEQLTEVKEGLEGNIAEKDSEIAVLMQNIEN